MSKVLKAPRLIKKPRILVIGGDEARNFGSKELKAIFDFEIIDRNKTSIPKFSGEHFDAVIMLPWRAKKMSVIAKKFADGRKIPCVSVTGLGQIRHYLADINPFFRRYFASLAESSLDEKPVVHLPEVSIPEVPKEEPKKEVSLWDEDQLWDAYGEGFVLSIKGLDGETTDRQTFVELLEGESGLKGEPIEVLMGLLRRQGIITEHEGGTIAIGKVDPVDVEQRKRFIEAQANAPTESHPHKEGRTSVFDLPSEELLSYYSRVDPKVIWKNIKELDQELGKLGLGKHGDGKPYSHYYMGLIHKKAKSLGVLFEQAAGFSFRVIMPGTAPSPPIVKALPSSQPSSLPTLSAPSREEPRVHVVKGTNGPLTSQPFAEAFPVEEKPQAQLPFPGNTEKKDISKTGVLYEMLEKRYPSKKIPTPGAMTPSIISVRGLFNEQNWDLAASKGIMAKLGLEETGTNYKTVISRKLDFTDEEWMYFASEFLRDQTIFSLLPIITNENLVFRVCGNCEKYFYFRPPPVCYDCRDKDRGTKI